MINAVCPKCLTQKKLVKHNILPLHHFGKEHKDYALIICQCCSDQLKGLLPSRKLDKDQYQAITFAWMRGYDITVV